MTFFQGVRAVLRKDVQSFWPLAVLTALLLIVRESIDNPLNWIWVIVMLTAVSWLTCAMLILTVVQEDAVVSDRHDWLVRPMPRQRVLIAKLLFVAGAVIVPLMIGALLRSLSHGATISESLLTGISVPGIIVLAILGITALAAITENMRQAALIVVAVGLTVTIGLNTVGRISNAAFDIGTSGMEWFAKLGALGIGFATCTAVLCLQYWGRRTRASFIVMGVGAALMLVLLLLPWPAYFAVQKVFSGESVDLSSVHIDPSEGCFPTAVVGDPSSAVDDPANAMPKTWREDLEGERGARAIAFAVGMSKGELPPNSKLFLNNVVATYMDGDRPLKSLRKAYPYPDSRRDAESFRRLRSYWIVSRDVYAVLAANPRTALQLDYSLTLARVEHTIEFDADGTRRYYEGLGFCGATYDSGAAQVVARCFIGGEQPAQLQAQIVGKPEVTRSSHAAPDFAPSILDFASGEGHSVVLEARGPATPRVKIIEYEAVSHFDRRVTIPGVLGGPVSSCPAPL